MLTGEASRRSAAPAPSSRSVRPKPAGATAGPRTPRPVDQYVELRREKTDRIFVVLAEFGNERHPDYPDQDTDPDTPGPATFEGPLHNAIPEPDRTKDNTPSGRRTTPGSTSRTCTSARTRTSSR